MCDESVSACSWTWAATTGQADLQGLSRRNTIVTVVVVLSAGIWLLGLAAYMGFFDSTVYRVRGTVNAVDPVPGDDGFVNACVKDTEDVGTEHATVEWDDTECWGFPVDAAPSIGACVVIEARSHEDATFTVDTDC